MQLNEQEQKAEAARLDAACEAVGTPAPVPITLEQVESAYDELTREYNVRERCFPKWIADGRVSKTDARDRLERICIAIKVVGIALDSFKKGVIPF